ncbi:hypothetical protein COR50_08425 [Chitinophaga caeni]|uniref:Chitin-binding type-2 domain-containing protein n=1 Tax=Chitinophaga caeni TaxID=2029983 RepID=A0A291QTE7_9BACT|nr:hypothetical protein [Chitinophaga caeni]ATL47207.1 hypothetical protein COR50_08425 [Chitinophaga caeni]
MKKLKIVFLVLAIGGSISASLATSSKAPCSSLPQYYLASDGNYYPAGVEGYDFVCEWDHFSNCTYYYDEANQIFRPCKAGKILWLR